MERLVEANGLQEGPDIKPVRVKGQRTCSKPKIKGYGCDSTCIPVWVHRTVYDTEDNERFNILHWPDRPVSRTQTAYIRRTRKAPRTRV